MKIKIATRLKPFSHTPGACCVIPGSCSIIQAFPTLLKIGFHNWKMALTGPISEFTLQQDLEKNCVWVFGKAKEGYFRLKIEAHDSGFHIDSDKGCLKSDSLEEEIRFSAPLGFERLSLGSHKAQEWDLLQKKGDLKAMLPILFCLGQKIPQIANQPLTGTAKLLTLPSDRNLLAGALEAFFKAAFKGMLVPTLTDELHQGIIAHEPALGDPFFLIQEGAKMIRGLFFTQQERRLSLLPNLPIPFDAGRLIGLKAAGIGEIDLEWSKKSLRRVLIHARASGEVLLELQREIKTFRVCKKKKFNRKEPILLEKGITYDLDRFEC